MADKSDNEYWAARAETSDAVSGALDQISNYQDFLIQSGRAARAGRAWYAYYGYGPNGDRDTSFLQPTGVQGEIISAESNLFGTLVKQTVSMTTADKLAFKVVAKNSDYKSMVQALLGDSLLDAYDRRIDLSRHEKNATHCGVLMSESIVALTWNATIGKELDVDEQTGLPVHEGDIEAQSFTPFRYAYDIGQANPEKMKWIALRKRESKYELAAKYPKVASQLKDSLTGTGKNEFERIYGLPTLYAGKEFTQCIDYWEVRHLPTAACPRGRMLIFRDADCVMFDSYSKQEDGSIVDSGYPYRKLYISFLRPEVTTELGMGHTSAIDLLSLQEALDMAVTAAVTNANAFSIKNLWIPPGANFSPQQASGGMNLWECSEKPEIVQTAFLEPSLMQFIDLISQLMLRREGMSKVTLGEPDKNMPAQMAALIEAQSIRYQSSLQESYARFVEEDRNNVIEMLKQFASTKRVMLLAGKSAGYQAKEFSSADLEDIERVTAEQMPPSMRTQAGRQLIASDLMERNQVNREEYLTLVTTGRMEPMYDGPLANRMKVQRWKELLQEGIGLPPVQMAPEILPDGMSTGVMVPMLNDEGLPVFVDDGQKHIIPYRLAPHWYDIKELLAVVAMQDSEGSPQVIAATTALVEHLEHLWSTMTVDQQKMLDCPPELIRMPMVLDPMTGMEVSPNGGAPMGGGTQTPPSGDGAKLPEGAPEIKMPKPPKNPLTGEQAPPPVA